MGLSIIQIKVARLLASGCSVTDAARKASVARSSIYNYRDSEEFNAAVQLFTTEQVTLAAGDEADVEQSRADELVLREYTRPLAEEMCGLVLDLIRHVRKQGIENISPARIQGLMNSTVEAVECLRKGNDRISGLEVLLDELGKTQEVHAAKIIPLAFGGSPETN